jgi:hypothetical protein
MHKGEGSDIQAAPSSSPPALNQQPLERVLHVVARRVLIFPTTPVADWEMPNMSGDEPHDPLAALRVPPTAQQVIEYIWEEIEHAISVALSEGDLAAAAQLLAKAQAEAERLLAELGGAPLVPRSPSRRL